MLSGVATPPVGPSIAYDFDFTHDQRIDRNGYVVISRDPLNPQLNTVLDVRLPAKDLATGTTLLLTPVAQPAGVWTSSHPGGFFYAGVTMTASFPVNVAVSDPNLAALFPTQATLTLAGTMVSGYFHQIALCTATLSGLSSTGFTLFLKQDLHEPDITWEQVAKPGLAVAQRAGGAGSEPLEGWFGLKRDPFTQTTYELVEMDLRAAGAPSVIPVVGSGPGGSAGTVTLDPLTHAVSGTLTLLVGGAPVVRTLDGVGDAFLGSPTMPTSLTITESGLGALTQFTFVGGRPRIAPGVNDFQIGATTTLDLHFPPGDVYLVAFSGSPVPGINTPEGDVLVTLDALFWFSVDPSNPFLAGQGGVAPTSGQATLSLTLPNDPQLIGFTAHFAGGSFHIDPFGVPTIRAATNPYRAIVQ
ncbi:MAG TPA: hypothetical protein VEI02_09710 [Planctomycetota bacterium]|nr:hypothetical protein [Planctomycetota bacterium]